MIYKSKQDFEAWYYHDILRVGYCLEIIWNKCFIKNAQLLYLIVC